MRTENYLLKEIQPTDISNIHKGLSDPEITRYYDVHFPTLEATTEQMEWYENLRNNETGIWWGIYDILNEQFCGAAGFNGLNKMHRKAEIGLWLIKDFWGRGILKEIMPRLFEYGFTKLDLNRIEGFVVSENLKCKKALEKIHFTLEGTMRECEIKNSEKINVDVYSILLAEWKKYYSK